MPLQTPMPLRKPALLLSLKPTEQWVNGVLAFANLEDAAVLHAPGQPRTSKYEGLVVLGPGSPQALVDLNKSSLLHVLHDLNSVSADDEGLRNSQARLRNLLDTLLKDGKTPEVESLISEHVAALRVQGAITYRDARLRFQSFTSFESPDQWWAVGIAALLDQGLGDRVRQCRWEKCSLYFVDWPGRKGGQTKLYCCQQHQNNQGQLKHRRGKRKNESANNRRSRRQ